MDFTSTDVLGQRVEFLSPPSSTLAQERDNSYDRLFDDPLKVETLNLISAKDGMYPQSKYFLIVNTIFLHLDIF